MKCLAALLLFAGVASLLTAQQLTAQQLTAQQPAAQQLTAQQPAAQQPGSLDDLRRVAKMIPGGRPLRINVLKFAESPRTKNFAVKGAPADPGGQSRTVFQVVYPDGYIMIDSGMDEPVHKTFGHGAAEPFDAAAEERIQQALRGARSIVMTHEHGDHVAGVIRSRYFDELAPKTVLTRTQAQTLMTAPQMPEIRMTAEMARRFIVIDYDNYFPFAPGIALMKAAGHTPGSQMIYVALASGAEYLFVGDSAWHMDNILLMKGKDASWVKEDEAAVDAQLKWLNAIGRTEKNVTIVVSHDGDQHKRYIEQHLLGGALE